MFLITTVNTVENILMITPEVKRKEDNVISRVSY